MKNKCEDTLRIPCLIMVTLIALAALIGPDIAMFIINQKHECTLGTEDGASEYVSELRLGYWMNCASVANFCMISVTLLVAMAAIFADEDDDGFCSQLSLCFVGSFNGDWSAKVGIGTWLFLCVWIVIGFLLQEEIRHHGVNHKECNQVLLAWLVVNVVTRICFCCGICKIVTDDDF